MNNRDYLKQEKMKLYYKYKINVAFSSLENCNKPFDPERYNELVKLKERYPKLTQDINSELNCYTEQRDRYKMFKTETIQEQYIPPFEYSESFIRQFLHNLTISVNMSEDFLVALIDICNGISNADLTSRQTQILLNFMRGENIGQNHKMIDGIVKKITNAINCNGGKDMKDKTGIDLDRNIYGESDTIDKNGNYFTRNPYYEAEVERSKERMEIIRQVSELINFNPKLSLIDLYKEKSMLETIQALEEISKERNLRNIIEGGDE